MDEQRFRALAAATTANTYLIELLLKWSFKDLPSEYIDQLADTINRAALKIDHLKGSTAGDEFASEAQADILVQAREYIANVVKSAQEGVEQTRGEAPPQGG